MIVYVCKPQGEGKTVHACSVINRLPGKEPKCHFCGGAVNRVTVEIVPDVEE